MDRLRHLTLRVGVSIFERLRRRLTPAGWLLFSFWLVTGAMGIDPTQSTAYQAFGLLTGLWIVSLGSLFFFRPRLKIERLLPRFATAGRPLRYRWRVLNEGKDAVSDIELRECGGGAAPDYAAFAAARGGLDESRNFVEQLSGYGRWRALARRQGAVSEPAALPVLGPGQSGEAPARMTPARRGRLVLQRAASLRVDPLGLLRAAAEFPVADQITVLPKRYPVGRISMGGSARLQPGGVALASRTGESPEFAGLREYRPGDPLRRIDWKSWAKEGRPIVREYHDEQFVRHALILDTFAGAGDAELFEEAVSVAASFAQTLLTAESLLDLLFVADRAYCVTAGRGLNTSGRLLEVLAAVERSEDMDFSELEKSVACRRHSLTACVLVLTAYDSARKNLVASLETVGIPTRAYVVCAAGTGENKAWGRSVRRLEMGKIAEGLA